MISPIIMDLSALEALGPQLGVLVAVLAFWTVPWKGYALWLAARRGEKAWFIILLVVNTLAVLEIVYIFAFGRRPVAAPQDDVRAAGTPPAST